MTLLPMMVGSERSCALCLATWMTTLSSTLVLLPILMRLTSPADSHFLF